MSSATAAAAAGVAEAAEAAVVAAAADETRSIAAAGTADAAVAVAGTTNTDIDCVVRATTAAAASAHLVLPTPVRPHGGFLVDVLGPHHKGVVVAPGLLDGEPARGEVKLQPDHLATPHDLPGHRVLERRSNEDADLCDCKEEKKNGKEGEGKERRKEGRTEGRNE